MSSTSWMQILRGAGQSPATISSPAPARREAESWMPERARRDDFAATLAAAGDPSVRPDRSAARETHSRRELDRQTGGPERRPERSESRPGLLGAVAEESGIAPRGGDSTAARAHDDLHEPAREIERPEDRGTAEPVEMEEESDTGAPAPVPRVRENGDTAATSAGAPREAQAAATAPGSPGSASSQASPSSQTPHSPNASAEVPAEIPAATTLAAEAAVAADRPALQGSATVRQAAWPQTFAQMMAAAPAGPSSSAGAGGTPGIAGQNGAAGQQAGSTPAPAASSVPPGLIAASAPASDRVTDPAWMQPVGQGARPDLSSPALPPSSAAATVSGSTEMGGDATQSLASLLRGEPLASG